MANVTNLQILRGLLRELRHVNHKEPLRKHPMYNYVLDQYRQYELTERKYCRGEKEIRHMAQTYLCFLESVRRTEELHLHYKGAGERPIEQAAELVGLKVPEKNVDDHPK